MNHALAAALWTGLLLACIASTPIHAGSTESTVDGSVLFSPEGYRIARYRGALPDDPPAGQRIGTEALAAFIKQQNPVLIDVQAVTVRPETAEFGLSWLPAKPRWNLPHSHWLPNVGYGKLEPHILTYFKRNLERLSGGDKHKPVVFYCVVDCWMSWNAIKRADELGYRNLHWYPEGTDGWREAGLPLVAAEPLPLDRFSSNGACASSGERPAFFECRPNNLAAALSRVEKNVGLKAVLLFFETNHCPFCHRMRQGLLRDPKLIDYFADRFIALAVNLESDVEIIDHNGASTTEAQYAKDHQRIFRTPTLVFLGADGEELYRHAGVIVDPGVFLALADYVSDGHYDRVGFREYMASITAYRAGH